MFIASRDGTARSTMFNPGLYHFHAPGLDERFYRLEPDPRLRATLDMTGHVKRAVIATIMVKCYRWNWQPAMCFREATCLSQHILARFLVNCWTLGLQLSISRLCATNKTASRPFR